MNLLLVGINHRTAPVEVRERMNIPESRLAEAVSDLVHREGILEALILSTCNRVEVATCAEENIEAASWRSTITATSAFTSGISTGTASRRSCGTCFAWPPASTP